MLLFVGLLTIQAHGTYIGKFLFSRITNDRSRILTSHIDWHLQAGLAIVFAEDTGDVATHNPVSSEGIPLFPLFCA